MFDNVSKFLVEHYSAEFATWLLGESMFRLENLECRFNVVRIWDVEPEVFLATPGLLPYAVLSRTDALEGMLRQVVSRLDELPDSASKNDLMAATSILGGLKLEGDTIRRVIRSEMMRESVIYQEIEQQGELKQAQSLILRLLNRRVGNLSIELETRLDDLGEALLDFNQMGDLVGWLDADRS
ncbi:DUF4351 domain-containing protein [Chamaesiphon sp.]|uniref:DUF4351 domain-containing protein n=1 Tax=Chamaesiphon sp. TaxID=2814140 RepID=UPI0035948035